MINSSLNAQTMEHPERGLMPVCKQKIFHGHQTCSLGSLAFNLWKTIIMLNLESRLKIYHYGNLSYLLHHPNPFNQSGNAHSAKKGLLDFSDCSKQASMNCKNGSIKSDKHCKILQTCKNRPISLKPKLDALITRSGIFKKQFWDNDLFTKALRSSLSAALN